MTANEEREQYDLAAARLRHRKLLGELMTTRHVVETIDAMFAELMSGLAEAGPIDPRAVAILKASVDRAQQKAIVGFQTLMGVNIN